MSSVPEFHTFREACECIARGGAAYRYGSDYPIYCHGNGMHSIDKRFWGGSAGECGTSASFSLDEQHSTNWVFIQKDKWQEREQRMKEAYAECAKRNAERQQRHEDEQRRKPKGWFSSVMATLSSLRRRSTA